MEVVSLPYPQLDHAFLGTIPVLTDNALARISGVRVAFTGRDGGVSAGPYGSLNLGGHVEDDPEAVAENIRRVARAFGADPSEVIGANQVHGTDFVEVRTSGAASLNVAREEAAHGADGLVVSASRVLGLLCFADCTPIIVVSPRGSYALVHGGWRGTCGHIARAAVERLCAADGVSPSSVNVYIGPHIKSCCFEVGPEVVQRFSDEFGSGCIAGDDHVDLAAAVTADVVAAGVDPRRIVEAQICTVHHCDQYYSYRASGGRCGRHGALAYRGA